MNTVKNHNFVIPNGDTDSISFCKPDMTPFTEEQVKELIQEMNDISAEFMDWEDDGYYLCVIVLKAKNYIMLKTNKKTGKDEITLKGSGIKDAKKEPILKDFMNEIIDGLLYEKNNSLEIYERYCNYARSITDISQWAVKKSISKKLLTSDRKQETDVVTALGDLSQYREGDKVFIYNTSRKFVPEMIEEEILISPAIREGRKIVSPAVYEKTGRIIQATYKSGPRKGEVCGSWVKVLKLTKNYETDADMEHYLQRIYDTMSIFENVLDMSQFACYTA